MILPRPGRDDCVSVADIRSRRAYLQNMSSVPTLRNFLYRLYVIVAWRWPEMPTQHGAAFIVDLADDDSSDERQQGLVWQVINEYWLIDWLSSMLSKCSGETCVSSKNQAFDGGPGHCRSAAKHALTVSDILANYN